MSTLPTVETPIDFEQTVYLRALLSSLPTVAPPAAFEAKVLKSAASAGLSASMVAIIVIAVASFSGVMWWSTTPDIVVVKSAYVFESPTADIYNLVPVPVQQDTRYKDLPPAVVHKLIKKYKKPILARTPHGVAGH